MIAIIETGGKQYVVQPGATLAVSTLPEAAGTSVTFDKVLLLADEAAGTVQVGAPYIDGATVTASIEEHGRAKKIVVVKFKPKVRYRRKAGHRQPFTRVKVAELK